MKRTLVLWLFGILLLPFTGCQKDNIVLVDMITTSDDENDDIANTTFAQTVYVTFSSKGNAAVTGTNDDFHVTTNGNDVTIVYSGDEHIMYELSGSASDGFFKLYSSRKQGITLNSLSLTNPNGAAINVQGPTETPNKGKRTFIVLKGINTLADGTSYADTPSTEDEKAVVFGEGQFIFTGMGSLEVIASGKSGIVSDDYLHFVSGAVTVNTSTSVLVSNGDTLKYANWNFSLKERLQLTHRTGDYNIYQNPANALMLKSRLTAKFVGFRKVEPYAYFELRNYLNAPVIKAAYLCHG